MEAIIKAVGQWINKDENIANRVARTIFNIRYSQHSKIVPLVAIDKLDKQIVEVLFEANSFTSYLPKEVGAEEQSVHVKMPQIALYAFNNAIVHAHSSAIYWNNQLVVSKGQDERINEGYLKYHNQDYGKIVYGSEMEEIEHGFFLAGNGTWNWFHYLVEILPKLILLQAKHCKVLLVSDTVLKIPNMQAILELLVQPTDFSIKYLASNKAYKVNTLLYINDFNHVQFNRFDNLIKYQDTYFNAGVLQSFVDQLWSRVNDEAMHPAGHYPAKIFLYRKQTHRIAANQDAILAMLAKDGFEAVSMDEKSVFEQLNYFKNAQFIIGISGAAWANLIFCSNRPKAICFLPNNAHEFCVYSNLAKIFKVDYNAFYYDSEQAHYASDFNIDIVQFAKCYKQLNEKQ